WKRIPSLFHQFEQSFSLLFSTTNLSSQLKMAAFDQTVSLVAENRPEGFYSELETTADQIVSSFDGVCY
ncbi:hypothetical protein PRIPAC_86909, partial [Pristionchus pacificus]|uniref:Uncharacterized protein n=1 Tax=Pristionchus pacificus TaxID=54126 RepID=A0A2A6BNG0_PRIPA